MTSPEAIKNVKGKHIRTLERRYHHLLGMKAIDCANDWDLAEIAALRVAIAELHDLVEARLCDQQREAM